MLSNPALLEVSLRMAAAIIIGCIIGIDRNLRGKPTGVKTLGLVALGAALVTMAGLGFSVATIEADDRSARVIQGIVTGIGFLGAGVILQSPSEKHIRGLTTAASIWVTAALGIVCGLGAWSVAAIATIMVILLLTVGRALEQTLHRRWLSKPEQEREAAEMHDE
ncbi:MgtC/SapB family protein [Pararobbsia alpina]|uniref:Protein MgtC n=1 Tax=Pararobbsia alpina TaxID=621374 RepID=A0A6S7BA59_9BURK|nr:MgtC/SapB family protein [Pararobbsia alpina]CAB3791142.1 Protein SrpB [Pararobbsia alpina]